jgi:hypothetical protein
MTEEGTATGKQLKLVPSNFGGAAILLGLALVFGGAAIVGLSRGFATNTWDIESLLGTGVMAIGFVLMYAGGKVAID